LAVLRKQQAHNPIVTKQTETSAFISPIEQQGQLSAEA
jgi:hypothetical protein